MKIQKRDGRVVPYEEEKIVAAIHKANNEVEEKDRADEKLIRYVFPFPYNSFITVRERPQAQSPAGVRAD